MTELEEEFLINRDREETELTIDFAKQILAIEIEIKEKKNEIKEIKKDAKDEGVSVMKVIKAITQLKYIMKTEDYILDELDEISKALENDIDVKTQISELARK